MKLTVDGRVYDFDLERISGTELREMHRKYKLTLKALMPAVVETDPDALACFWWLLKRQNGRDFDGVPLNDDLEFPAGALLAALNEPAEGDGGDEAGEGEPDPTQPLSSPTGSEGSPAPSTRRGTTRLPHASPQATRSVTGSSPASTSS